MRRLAKVIPVLCFTGAAAVSPAILADDHTVVGEEFDYTVRRGDTLAGIGARFGVSPQSLAARNRLAATGRLVRGKVLRVDNRHIVPKTLENGILINIPQRLLFYFVGGRLDAWYPVALGQPGSWQTPTGSYQVLQKEKDPVWEVPDSIQQEMRRKGESPSAGPAGPGQPARRVPAPPFTRVLRNSRYERPAEHFSIPDARVYPTRAAGCRRPLFSGLGGRSGRNHLRAGASLPGSKWKDLRRGPSRRLSPHGRQPGGGEGDRREPRPRVSVEIRALGRDPRRGGRNRGPSSSSDERLD